MSREDEERIQDILEVADQLNAMVDKGKGEYFADFTLQFAIERALQIIGEASSHLSAETRDKYPNIPWEDIIALRILITHVYHRIDHVLIWNIASESVPALAATLRSEDAAY